MPDGDGRQHNLSASYGYEIGREAEYGDKHDVALEMEWDRAREGISRGERRK